MFRLRLHLRVTEHLATALPYIRQCKQSQVSVPAFEKSVRESVRKSIRKTVRPSVHS